MGPRRTSGHVPQIRASADPPPRAAALVGIRVGESQKEAELGLEAGGSALVLVPSPPTYQTVGASGVRDQVLVHAGRRRLATVPPLGLWSLNCPEALCSQRRWWSWRRLEDAGNLSLFFWQKQGVTVDPQLVGQ